MSDAEISLGLNDKEYQRGLEGVERDTKRAARNSGDSLEQNVGNRGAAAFKRVAVAASAAAAAVAAGLFTRASIRAASEQEAVTRRLETALFASGQEVEENSKKIQEFANELQKTTTLSNEAVEAQAAYALSLGVSAQNTIPLVRASADLSSALGVSLQGATQRLARTLQGDLSPRLAQLVPELRDLTEEQLRAGAAVDIVAQRFAGVAASEAQTFGGSIAQLSETFADLQKAFGQFVTESNAVRKAIQLTNQGIQSISEFLERIQPQVTAFGESFARGFLVAGRQVEIFVRGAVSLLDPFFIFFQARVNTILGVFNRFGAQLQGIINVFTVFRNSIVGGFNEIRLAAFNVLDSLERLDRFNVTGLSNFREEIDKGILESLNATQDSAKETRDSINRLFDPEEYKPQEVTEVFRNFFEEIDQASRNDEGELIFDRLLAAFSEEKVEETSQNVALLGENIRGTLNETADEVDKSVIRFEKASVDISNALKNAFVNTATQSFQEFGKQIAQGEMNFKSFVGIALNALGDLAISIGSTVIAASLAIQSIPFAGGVLLGAALVAVGGAIKAFSSKFGGGQGGASPSFSQGGAGAASPPPTVPDTDPVTQERDRGPSQNVQLVVQGDILDSEDTGRRLIEVLNDNFRSDNSALVGARFA